jgi:hypothetical protein
MVENEDASADKIETDSNRNQMKNKKLVNLKHRKKEVSTSIPSYNLNENATKQLFQNCTTYTDLFFYSFRTQFSKRYQKLPSYKNYRSSFEDLGVNVVKTTMAKNRFEQFLVYLHINDNTTIPTNNKDKKF